MKQELSVLLCGVMTHFKERHCSSQKVRGGCCKSVSGLSDTASEFGRETDHTHVLHLHLSRATVVLWAVSFHTEERCENEHKSESGKDVVSGQQNKYSVGS